MAKTLIAFFSRADENYFGGAMRYIEIGNTEIAVQMINEIIGADVFKIEMKMPYAKEYMTCINEAKADLQKKARPQLVTIPDSIDGYDTVILGYPNYWGTMPMAVFTFLEAFDFSGKTILPLCTNEGSGMGVSERDIRKACPGAVLKLGLPLNGSRISSAKPQIEKWLKANGLIERR
ncbi:MAG: flavodoxin [Clostridia bacterium]|nr:flavodoxin [Clostridia bacterium]